MTVANKSAAYPAMKGRSYSNPLVISYPLGALDFGDGPAAQAIAVPSGCKYMAILECHLAVTETFACDTTTAKVRVGTTGDADAYFELIVPDATAATDGFNLADDTDAIKYSDGHADISSLSQLELTFVQSADSGVAAGIAETVLVVAWW